MKKYIIEVIKEDDGTIKMNRTNDGFNIAELLGFIEITRFELFDILKKELKVDEIKRNVIID